jgi:hypothetical protein
MSRVIRATVRACRNPCRTVTFRLSSGLRACRVYTSTTNHLVVMSISLPHAIRGWRAVLLLVVVALSPPGKASAGCGDYISYPNSHATDHGKPVAATDDGTTPAKSPCLGPNCSHAPLSRFSGHELPAKAPCQGPNCSGGPVREVPPAPPTPVTNPTKEQARPFRLHDEDGASSCDKFDRDLNSPRPIHRAYSIFHPPRLG